MVVQHNMQAMNANRMLGVTTGQQAKSTEKLSSGYRINRAADDAAGLTISEKMRKQIRGLDRASTNAEDGVSSVQTAEGALTEVHSMLQRMNELATQAANGTNSKGDRDAIQAEIEQLTTEIDRVAETTKFNEIYLLKGDKSGTTSEVDVNAHDAGLAGKLTANGDGTSVFEVDKALEDGDKVTIAGKEYTIGSGKSAGSVLDPADLNTSTDGYAKVGTGNLAGTTALAVGDSVTYKGNTYTLTDNVAVDDLALAKDNTFKIGETTYKVVDTATDVSKGEYTAADAMKAIKEALADGKQVTGTSAKVLQKPSAGGPATATAVANFNIVSSLEKGEISTHTMEGSTLKDVLVKVDDASTTQVTTGIDLAAGDSVTKGGVTTTATEAVATSAKDVYDGINALAAGNTVKIGSGDDAVTYTIVDDENDIDETSYKVTKDMILAQIQDGDKVNINGATDDVTVIGDIGSTGSLGDVITAKDAYKLMTDELKAASSIGADKAAEVTHDGNGKFSIKQGTVEVKDALSFALHVGSDADMTNKINVDIEAMNAAGLGIKGLNVSDESGMAATYAIDSIQDAISKVSAQRSSLGAVQNRLEHTIANLDNIVENTTAAESRIRDTDMAKEMVEYSKNNILAQAGQSMLAQANQSNQGVLSLLG